MAIRPSGSSQASVIPSPSSASTSLFDMLTLPQRDTPNQEWTTVAHPPPEYIFIIDLGGHFIYAIKDLKKI